MTDQPPNRTARPERQVLLSTASQIATNGRYVEVGTYHGDFAVDILNHCKPVKLYCVDPYKSYDAFADAINHESLDTIYNATKARLAPYGDQAEILRMTSVEAAQRFADGSVDFVYIDGDHSYAYVLQDLETWFPKLREGGLLCGDDAVDNEADDQRNEAGDVMRVWKIDANGAPLSWGHYGVLKAAREFCARHNLQLLQTGVQYLIFKGATVREA